MFRFHRRSVTPPLNDRTHACLSLELLEGREQPAFLAGADVVVGADAGSPPIVSLIDPTTHEDRSRFLAFESTFYGGVRVAVGDVNGDGVPDLVAAAGPSGGPVVKVYDGKSGNVLTTFYAYDQSFTGGVYVATGDTDGDGVDEIITGAGAGGGPQVSVFDGDTGTPITSFFAYSSSLRSGVRVAAGDVSGDKKAEVITGPGYGGGPHIRIYSQAENSVAYIATGGFMAFAPSFIGGVNLAVGNVLGDGQDEIVVGAGPTGGPQVSVFDGAGDTLDSFFAYDAGFRGGVRVGVAELTGEGNAEVITAAGPGGGPHINVYTLPSSSAESSFFAFPSEQLTGVWVDGASAPLNLAPTDTSTIAEAYTPLRNPQRDTQPIQYVPVPVSVPVIQRTIVPYWYGGGYGGFGFYNPYWIGSGFYDAPGLYLPLNTLYQSNFFSIPSYSISPSLYNPGYIDPTYYSDPFFDGINQGYYDPGYYNTTPFMQYFQNDGSYYYNGGSYYDDGSYYYDDGTYYDPGSYYYDDGSYYDPGSYYYDDGSYYDPGSYYYDGGYYDSGSYFYDDSFYGGGGYFEEW